MSEGGNVPVMQTAEDIQRLASLPENAGLFTLYRADTHGTEVPIVMNVSEDFARSAMIKLEKTPHHQGYWFRVPGHEPS